jgi:hypothetical protein
VEYLKEFLKEWGDELGGIIVIGMHKDGDIIDGWSFECRKNTLAWLGAIEQCKMDFWNTCFEKRSDIIDGS